MKTNILKSAAALFAAAAVLSGCLPSKLGNTPSLTIQAAQENFDDNGEATVSLVLSEAASDDVAVNLSASGDLASAVSFDKAVVISAGNKSLDVKVTLTDKTKSGGVTIAIDAVNGATIGKDKSVTLVATKAAVPTVTISKYDDVFNENNAATITLALNPAASADVTVTLAVAAKESEEFAVIPADAVTFDAQVKIPAGEKSATATVSVNPELLPTGDSYLYIDVTAVSEGAEIGKNIEAVICFTKPIVANLRSDWTVTYGGNYEYELQDGTTMTTDLLNIAGLGEQPFILDYYQEGTLEYNEMTPAQYVLYKDERIKASIAEGATAEDLNVIVPTADPYSIVFDLFDPGTYEVILLACSQNGSLTGDYAYSTFEIIDPEEATEEYQAWTGKWTIGGKTYYIDPKWNNKSYTIWGFDEDYYFGAPVNYDAEKNTIRMEFAYLDASSSYEYYLCAYSADNYMVYGDPEDNYLIANISIKDGAYSIDPVTYNMTYNDGTTAVLTASAIGVMGYGLKEQGWYSFKGFNYITLPTTDITKVEEATEPTEPAGAPALKNVVRFEKIDAVSSRVIKPLHRQISQKRVSGIDSLR